jgi:hypothetical protein
MDASTVLSSSSEHAIKVNIRTVAISDKNKVFFIVLYNLK